MNCDIFILLFEKRMWAGPYRKTEKDRKQKFHWGKIKVLTFGPFWLSVNYKPCARTIHHRPNNFHGRYFMGVFHFSSIGFNESHAILLSFADKATFKEVKLLATLRFLKLTGLALGPLFMDGVQPSQSYRDTTWSLNY